MSADAPPGGEDPTLPRFLSVHQIAEYLQLNEKKVYALAAEGKLPGTKITGKWLFPRDLVDQWLVESSHGGVLTDRLIIAGSDDPLLFRAVSAFAAQVEARALVSYTPTGTRLGLSLLAAERVNLCAVHWGPAAESEVRHPALLRRYPQHNRWVLVRLFLREQGLILGRGLAAHHPDARALGAARLRWAMRQEGAGSQRFLHETAAAQGLALDGLDVVTRAGSEREAAALVAMGEADVAPGVRAAATEFGLDFLRTGQEAFDVALPRGIYFRTLFQHLLDTLRGEPVQALAARLHGYDLAPLGRLVWSA